MPRGPLAPVMKLLFAAEPSEFARPIVLVKPFDQ